MRLLTKKQMDEIIWRKKTVRISHGLIWETQYDNKGKPESCFGKKIKGGKQ